MCMCIYIATDCIHIRACFLETCWYMNMDIHIFLGTNKKDKWRRKTQSNVRVDKTAMALYMWPVVSELFRPCRTPRSPVA